MLVKDVMHGRAVAIDPNETLPSAAVMMEELGVKRLPVMQGGRVVGLLTDGEIKRKLPHVSEGLSAWDFAVQAGRVRVREAMRMPVLTLTPETPLASAVQTMLERRVGGLPVVDEDGELRGMLTLTDVLRRASESPNPAWGTAGEHMSREVVSVAAEDPANEGAARLTVSRLRVLPVLSGGKLLGLLHEKDVTAALEREVAAQGGQVASSLLLRDQPVTALMRAPSGRLTPQTPLAEVMHKMVELDVHGLPVVGENDELLGVVTVSDVLKAMVGTL
ncbi:CBS domain-containing protein [Deinococcus sp. VB343]|uniref:CBS domain-containing protein n=1 Tax=Deinococcus sp. VB142 TaxID=3112952 RepID=A0AAU6Q588_9DEIO